MGRRHHRSRTDSRCARPGLRRGAQRADPRSPAVRRVQDVTGKMILLLALAAQTTSTRMPRGEALPPPTDGEQAVLASAQALLTSFNTGNPAEILRWVYPDGRVTGTGTLPNRTGVH